MLMRCLTACLFAFLAPPAYAADAADPFAAVKGVWLTEEKDGAVELYNCGDELCGKFYWLKAEPGVASSPDLDDKNPDPKLRNRPLCGMQFMGGFKPDEDGAFTGGWIYSPRHGARFSSKILTHSKDELELRGYMVLPVLGASQTWTKAENITPCELPYDSNHHKTLANHS
jgi:uncharacterized protein (DUF2147 family)